MVITLQEQQHAAAVAAATKPASQLVDLSRFKKHPCLRCPLRSAEAQIMLQRLLLQGAMTPWVFCPPSCNSSSN